jgi:phosphoenolpyruvate carboxylase
MQNKLIFLTLFYASTLFGSLNDSEKRLIDNLRNQYVQCQKHWNIAAAYNSKRIPRWIVENGLAKEANKLEAQLELEAFRTKQLEQKNAALKAQLATFKKQKKSK